MAVKIFNVRLQNLYCTYQELSDANPVLLNGETCYVSIPEGTGIVPNEPAVLMKIGDGSTHWNDLPFINSPSAQGDWEQNDETKADYIKNRTHWEESSETVFLEETVLTDGKFVNTNEALPFIEGDTYITMLDGERYESICKRILVEDGASYYGVGNLSLANIGEDNGEPYCVMTAIADGFNVTAIQAIGYSTVKIFAVSKVVHKIDKKYLYAQDWQQNDPEDGGYIKNRTHWEDHRVGTVATITIEDGYSNGGSIVDIDLARHIYFGGQYLDYQFATMSSSGDAVISKFIIDGNKAGVSLYREDVQVGCSLVADIDSGIVDFSHGGIDGAIQSVTISGSYDYTYIKKLDEKYLDVSTSDDAIDLLTESGFITPAYAGSNTFYTDNNGVIYTI